MNRLVRVIVICWLAFMGLAGCFPPPPPQPPTPVPVTVVVITAIVPNVVVPLLTPTAVPGQFPTPLVIPTLRPIAVYPRVTLPPGWPTTTPTPYLPPGLTPEFIYPQNGQVLDIAGAYLFKVTPVAGADSYLWSFMQNGVMVWENYRDERVLSTTEYGIFPGTPAHARFVAGEVELWVRGLVAGRWSEPGILRFILTPLR